VAGFPVHFARPPNSLKDRIASPTPITRSTGSDFPPGLKAIVGETKRTDASEITSQVATYGLGHRSWTFISYKHSERHALVYLERRASG
jgi:hypothetical protein